MIEFEWNVHFIKGHKYDTGNHWTIDMRNARYCAAQINWHNETNINKRILNLLVSDSQRTLLYIRIHLCKPLQ
jgi:hypothetical protein